MDHDLHDTSAPDIDHARFRQVLGHFCTGITIVTGMEGGAPVGFTAQSFSSLSLEPPLVLVCPAKSSSSWPRIAASGSFCVNIIAEDQEAVCRTFASSGGDKFAGIGWAPSAVTGSPVLDGALGWVDCRLEQEIDAGDHVIAIGRVVHLGVDDDTDGPLLFYRGGYGRFEP